jgi:hypothetical protein
LNKKSRCFIKEITKVLKTNKIKNSSKICQNGLNHNNKSYLNFDSNISDIHFKANASSKCAKTSAEIKKIIAEDKQKKESFNFEAFL